MRLRGGALEYLHRLDRQVKIRGHRVELGEVEHALSRVPGVSGAHITVHDGGMVAHYVGDVSAESLRAHLAAEVPEFMVPAAFVARAAFARTTNGKADTTVLQHLAAQSPWRVKASSRRSGRTCWACPR